jgi:hypothetical protein
MRRGTFFAPLTALFLLGVGCVELPGAPDDDPPEPDSPLGLLETFEWCYDRQDEGLYAELLDPAFTCILFPDQEYQGDEETPPEWGREQELARFADLCDACGEGDIGLDLDPSGYGEPDPEDEEWLIPNVEYSLGVVFEDITYLVGGRADFLTVRAEEGRWRLLELRGFERPELPL